MDQPHAVDAAGANVLESQSNIGLFQTKVSTLYVTCTYVSLSNFGSSMCARSIRFSEISIVRVFHTHNRGVSSVFLFFFNKIICHIHVPM